MLQEFIFTAEGLQFLRQFKTKFSTTFRIDEPSVDSIIMDAGDLSYKITENISADEFKTLVTESIETGKNLLLTKSKK